MMNQQRQMLSLAIALYGIVYLIYGNDKKFLSYVIVGSLIHYSSIIILILYFLKDVDIKKNVKKYFGAAIIPLVMYDTLYAFLLKTKYARFIVSGYNIRMQTSVVINTAVRATMLIIILLSYKRLLTNAYSVSEKRRICIGYNMAIISVIIQIWTLRSAMFGRLSTFFFLGFALMIPEIIENMKIWTNRMVGRFMTIVFMTVYHFVYYTNSAANIGVDTYDNIISHVFHIG